jgi:DNA-binding transcriptional LysR family regulator
MDLNRYKYFLTLVKTEHLRKASEILHISPPALSKSIKILEEEIGAPLIEAEGRGIKITEKGRELAQLLSAPMEVLSHLKTHLEKEQMESKEIKIGTFEVFSTYFLGRVLKNELKNFDCALYELVPGEIEEMCASDKIDIGITYHPIAHSQITHTKICDISMDVFGREELTKEFQLFNELPFVIPVRPINATPTKARGLDGWPDDKIFRNVKYKVALLESALELCRQGVAVAYLPSFIVELHNESLKKEFQLFPISHHLKAKDRKQSVYLVRKKSSSENTIDKKIAKALRSLRN